MPLRVQPATLRAAAMTCIARHFDLICYAAGTPQRMAALIESGDYLNVASPFDDLPPALCEDLSEAIKSISHLRRHHLHALLSPSTRRWAASGVADLLVAIDLLPRRCKNLQKLDISYVRHINPNALISLAPVFTSLVSLNLRMTLTVDQMLGKIGEQCVHLLELNLTSTAITDRGMVMLCLSPDGSARCQALRRLCVADTWVTCSGAAVALLALPALQHFDFDRMFEAMRILEAWEGTAGERVMAALGVCSARRPLSPRPALALTTVTSCGEAGSGSHGPSVTARLCPRAASLTVSGTPLPAEALYPLMVLRNLTALSLTACGAACDFEAGVLPLLTALGHQLNSLILAKFFSVDVGAIGMACPHLVNFALSDVTAFELMNQKISAESFQELQALEIWSDADFIIPTNVLQQLLLFSKNIRNILLKGVGIVTDEMFSEILKVNPMRQLSHLTLDNCHCVTHATVHRILDADNELCMLRIWSCYRINKEANDIISQRIANENMDIYLDWFPVDD
ncbi:uncharacterized protein LOC124171656 isoform X2 [Ischnura elegans]|uniref:uncharacterized protein LOC124171656 isoform X2 n=1 Tax=Ischnura elegans TaxID=197161 RepID=UPI001ED8738B|nr:uncharacterized protein LOC124171656 isoform X2 [Ischnura elegans]